MLAAGTVTDSMAVPAEVSRVMVSGLVPAVRLSLTDALATVLTGSLALLEDLPHWQRLLESSDDDV